MYRAQHSTAIIVVVVGWLAVSLLCRRWLRSSLLFGATHKRANDFSHVIDVINSMIVPCHQAAAAAKQHKQRQHPAKQHPTIKRYGCWILFTYLPFVIILVRIPFYFYH